MTGRIIKGVGGLYTVAAPGGKTYYGKARGILRKEGKKPYIGDFVEITVLKGDECVIEGLLERKNSLIRPRVANIDCAVVVFAAKEPELSFDMLGRFLLFAESRKIPEIIIGLNKCDIGSPEIISRLKNVYNNIYDVFLLCGETGEGVEELKERLKGKVSVLAGPSGVGKSTIVNRLAPHALMETGEVSGKIKRGRHTTRHIELLSFGEGSYIVDSPGFTSLDLSLLKADEICEYFKEFKPYLEGCRFRNCRHLNEPDCRLKEQVGKSIKPERYEFYKKIVNEIRNGVKY